MPNYVVNANSTTATPLSAIETTLTGIVTIAVQTEEVDVYIMHSPTGAPADGAAVRAGKFKIIAGDQFQTGSGAAVDLSTWYVATESGTADTTAIGA